MLLRSYKNSPDICEEIFHNINWNTHEWRVAIHDDCVKQLFSIIRLFNYNWWILKFKNINKKQMNALRPFSGAMYVHKPTLYWSYGSVLVLRARAEEKSKHKSLQRRQATSEHSEMPASFSIETFSQRQSYACTMVCVSRIDSSAM